jgi:hypothetical protein
MKRLKTTPYNSSVNMGAKEPRREKFTGKNLVNPEKNRIAPFVNPEKPQNRLVRPGGNIRRDAKTPEKRAYFELLELLDKPQSERNREIKIDSEISVVFRSEIVCYFMGEKFRRYRRPPET